jgi:hypothetical protein
MPITTLLFASIAGTALSARPENFRSPLSYDAGGWLVSNSMGTDGSSLHSLRLRLTSGSMDMIAATAQNVLNSETISFSMVSNPLSMFRLELPRPLFTGSSAVHSYLGIGFDSELTRNAESVAVIRNTTSAELVFGATREFFNSTCIPGTMMTLQVPPTGHMAVQIKFRNETAETSFGQHHLGFSAVAGALASVPNSLRDRIVNNIILAGMMPSSRPAIFRGCSESAIATLPNIELTFENGSLMYFPQDYLVLNESDGTCKLRISGTTRVGTVDIEPLFLADTNVRVTSENVWDICESVAIA